MSDLVSVRKGQKNGFPDMLVGYMRMSSDKRLYRGQKGERKMTRVRHVLRSSGTSRSLWTKLWVMVCYPLLHQRAKGLGVLHEFLRLALRDDVGVIIVEEVALAPTRLKVAGEVGNRGPHGQLDGFKGGLVMAGAHHPVSRTRNRHLGQLQDRVVGGGKLPVGREARKPRVGEVPGDHRTEALQFSATCEVGLHAMITQERLPAHACRLE